MRCYTENEEKARKINNEVRCINTLRVMKLRLFPQRAQCGYYHGCCSLSADGKQMIYFKNMR